GHLDIVRMLLAAGADPNIEGAVEYGMAPQAVSYAGHQEIVRLLVENGAEVNARGEVLFRFSADIINILPEGGEFGTALRAASAGSN
ncbi:hypothetical protein B0H13DRAFT_1477243, partial [Mycena leptocephala]